MSNKGKKLTPKQERFCLEYTKDLNGTQAAIRAGYSENTANRIASENLSKLDIKEKIDKLLKKSEKRSEITMDDIRKGVADIATSEEEKSADRLKAFDMLTKMFGGYEEHNDQKKPDLKATIKFTK